jgi:hypothetical protein
MSDKHQSMRTIVKRNIHNWDYIPCILWVHTWRTSKARTSRTHWENENNWQNSGNGRTATILANSPEFGLWPFRVAPMTSELPRWLGISDITKLTVVTILSKLSWKFRIPSFPHAERQANLSVAVVIFQLKLEFYWNSQISDLMKVPSDIFELLYADTQTQFEAKRRTFATFSCERTWSW